ncbi:uncharacterized protein Ecym_4774 [Eremothecium cymbalariae DBVPG|uniref:Uncharacterized protein n=1 Tax=Eremothecium cymbalariae (strain CBS 270.75 / DBVPG 7215 / KCTC 17166 / NRRL Y-17582) TaxID=931890 RepID=G8JSR4_ERECY|nr:hypothetical protein Ecym_4774 [Eremothecium cymbalariae DBVPG\
MLFLQTTLLFMNFIALLVLGEKDHSSNLNEIPEETAGNNEITPTRITTMTAVISPLASENNEGLAELQKLFSLTGKSEVAQEEYSSLLKGVDRHALNSFMEALPWYSERILPQLQKSNSTEDSPAVAVADAVETQPETEPETEPETSPEPSPEPSPETTEKEAAPQSQPVSYEYSKTSIIVSIFCVVSVVILTALL